MRVQTTKNAAGRRNWRRSSFASRMVSIACARRKGVSAVACWVYSANVEGNPRVRRNKAVPKRVSSCIYARGGARRRWFQMEWEFVRLRDMSCVLHLEEDTQSAKYTAQGVYDVNGRVRQP
jgi:hypothetical protein